MLNRQTIFVKHLRVPLFSETIKSKASNLVGTTCRSNPDQGERSIKTERIFGAFGEVPLGERCCCNRELGPNPQINVPGIDGIQDMFDMIRWDKHFFRRKIEFDSPCRFSLDCMCPPDQVSEVAAQYHQVVISSPRRERLS